jgi:hypothetical protein
MILLLSEHWLEDVARRTKIVPKNDPTANCGPWIDHTVTRTAVAVVTHMGDAVSVRLPAALQ